MAYSDLFVGLAQISVLIGGFAGIAVLVKRPGGTMPGSERVRVINLFILTLAATLFALAPVVLHACGLSAERSLRLAQLFLTVGLALLLALRFLPSLRTAREAGNPNVPVFAFMIVLFVAIILLQALSAMPTPIAAAEGSYLAGVVIILFASSINFFRLIIQYPNV